MDPRINELFRQYCPNPVFLIIDVQLKEVGLPTKAYVSIEEVLEVRRTQTIFWVLLVDHFAARSAFESGHNTDQWCSFKCVL